MRSELHGRLDGSISGQGARCDLIRDQVLADMRVGGAWATAAFSGLRLSSRYQAIFSARDRTCIGYEGLLTGLTADQRAVAPAEIFALAAPHAKRVHLDWLSRALHLRNLRNLGDAPGLLFVNVCPSAAIEDPRFDGVFAGCMAVFGVRPESVVVEILENHSADEARLAEAAELYRSLGCTVAIDDFGAGYSEIERVRRLRPDIVKIDRAAIAAAAQTAAALQSLQGTVRMLHDCGARVVIEGIETAQHEQIAGECGADFLQGYYLARPGLARVA